MTKKKQSARTSCLKVEMRESNDLAAEDDAILYFTVEGWFHIPVT